MPLRFYHILYLQALWSSNITASMFKLLNEPKPLINREILTCHRFFGMLNSVGGSLMDVGKVLRIYTPNCPYPTFYQHTTNLPTHPRPNNHANQHVTHIPARHTHTNLRAVHNTSYTNHHATHQPTLHT